jgi:trans-aconitate 2-methyltransferase
MSFITQWWQSERTDHPAADGQECSATGPTAGFRFVAPAGLRAGAPVLAAGVLKQVRLYRCVCMAGSGDRYTFGDSNLAARRLAIVAEIFQATTARFLRHSGTPAPDLAVDLGCGPGHTTQLLNETVRPKRTIAVDFSTAFVELAADRLGDTAEVLNGDVLDLPEAVPAADLMFARLLLTHLTDPVGAVRGWVRRLSSGGVLMLEEVESITTEEPTFCAYLDLQRGMLAANRQTLEIGAALDATLTPSMGYRSELATTTPPTAAVARMFAMNFAVWRHEPIVELLATVRQVDEIATGLEHLLAADDAALPITWRMRQIVISPQT